MSQDVAAKYPFHAIIFDYVVTKRTGILTFEPGGRKLFFEAGQLVFANSDEPDEHFASILVESGTFSQEQLDQAKQEVGPGKSLGRQLKGMGLATSQQLAHALKQQITCIVDAALSQTDGDCQTTEKPLPARLPKLKIQTLGLIIKSIFKMDSETFSIPIQLDQPLYKTTIGDLNLSKIAIPPTYLELFNFLRENESFSPDTLQEIAQLNGAQLQKMIYVLHQLGVITFEDESSLTQEPLTPLSDDETAPSQEPLAELSDDETFQDDTLGEDALATVLPSTTPPKTDPSGALDPSRAVRQINLPNFVQEQTPNQTPTLRVQDPRKSEPLELEETVRQFQPDFFGSTPEQSSSNQLPKLEEAIALDQDLSTISRELDSSELLHITEDDEEELLPVVENIDDETLLPSSVEDLELATDAAPVEPSFEEDLESVTNPQPETIKSPLSELTNLPAFDSPPTFDDLSLHDDSKAELKDLINTPGMEPESGFEPTVYLDSNESKFDTEPALPRSSFDGVTPLEETQNLPTDFQAEIPELDGLEETPPTAPVIMPQQQEDENYFLDSTDTKPRRSLLKWLAAILVILALSLVGYRLYENQTTSELTNEYLEEKVATVAEGTDSPAETSDSSGALDEPFSEDSSQPPQPDTGTQDDPSETMASSAEELSSASISEEEDPQNTIAESQEQTASLESDLEEDPETELPLPKPVVQSAAPPSTEGVNQFSDLMDLSQQKFQDQNATHSLVILVACQAETVENSVKQFNSEDIFLIPRTVNGESCWMITWGAFGSHSEAVSARVNFPQEFRQGNDPVWVVKPSW